MSDKDNDGLVPLNFERLQEATMRTRAQEFRSRMETRRSVRFFSDEPVPLDVVHEAIQTAGTAPSGAHKQPWQFVVVTDPAVKAEIRRAAELEEKETYAHRMSDEWREALRPIGTSWEKPFLEIVPVIVVVFRRDYDLADDGSRRKNYYVQESVGLATGMLIAALHNAGLATLTHTPSPMNFLSRILNRPRNEKPYLVLPVGYPREDCVVPDFDRKPLAQIMTEV